MQSQQAGFTLIEVLVAFLIITVGLLGLGALQTSTMNNQLEAYQRAQVTVLVDDMANRVRANPVDAAAGSYSTTAIASTAYGTLSTTTNCAGLTNVIERDLCEWNELLAGVSAKAGTTAVGAPIGARGCLSVGPVSGSGEYVVRVAVAWQGLTPSAAPAAACGKDAYGDDTYRRVIYRDVAVRG
jgi:type IV pilus assembly protein PilV